MQTNGDSVARKLRGLSEAWGVFQALSDSRLLAAAKGPAAEASAQQARMSSALLHQGCREYMESLGGTAARLGMNQRVVSESLIRSALAATQLRCRIIRPWQCLG